MAKNDGKVHMVKTLILLPKTLRTELEMIRQRDGVSLSLQARLSLILWVNAVKKHPLGAQGMMGNAVSKAYKLGQWGKGSDVPIDGGLEPKVQKPYDPGPEPDQHLDPVAWSKWSAKAGNAMIAKLAKGEWSDE